MLADSRKRSQGKEHVRAGLGGVSAMCAFHPSERITNFCTNQECLLPLCPKCVKIHAEQHIKMGIFGQFDTIGESLAMAEDGLKYTVGRLGQFQKLVLQIRQSYDSKLASEKKVLREAKNYFFEEIQKIFDGYEKAILAYQHTTYKQFFDDLYQSEELLTHLSQHCEKALKRLANPQSVMEGVINYYSQVDEIEKVDLISQNLQRNFPENIRMKFYPQELDRLESTIKRYLDTGEAQESIWAHYKQLFSKEEPSRSTYSASKTPEYINEPIGAVYKKRNSPPRQNFEQKPHKIASNSHELNRLQANTALDKFKSPLDSFSLSRLRRQRNDYE